MKLSELQEEFNLLTMEGLQNLMDILETTDTVSTKQKKQFGIKRR